MGTRYRCVLIAYGRHIIMWGHWDGYLDYAGKHICRAIRKLLKKYGHDALVEMVSRMKPLTEEELDESTEETVYSAGTMTLVVGREGLDAAKLGDIIVSGKYYHDECDDIEYEYTIDFDDEEVIVSSPPSYHARLEFEQIQSGKIFADFVDDTEYVE